VKRRQELILAAVGAVVVLTAGMLLLVRPTKQATAQARADREVAAAESQTLRDQIKALETLRPKEAELRAQANLAKGEFPATPALPGLIDALQDSANLAGVELGAVSPAAPKASVANPKLAEIVTNVTVSGGYFEIQDFLARIENLVRGTDPGRVPPRSVLVQSVNLTGGGAEGTTSGDSAAATPDAAASPDELQGSIVLIVFQLAQSNGASSTPATPAATASQGAQVR
jgi:Tfp pilus assembly protein PilO